MKKVSLLILVSLILLLSFASCTLLDQLLGKAPAECEHEWTEATCTAPKTCTKCNATEGEAAAHDWAAATCTAPKTCKTCNETEGAPNGHTEVTLEAVAPTCTSTGLTEGKKCSVCNTVTKEQTTVAKLAHTEVDVLGTAATCTTTGLTDGKQCSVCQTWTVPQETIPEHGHTLETLPGKAATCTEDGLTEGKKCSVCQTVTVAQETIPAAHTEVTLEAVEATCKESGLTEGKKCSVCDTVLVAQEVVPALDHDTEGATAQKENDHPATCMAPGGYDMVTRCWECGEVVSTEHFVYDQLEHKFENYTHDEGSEKCGVDGTQSAYCVFECGTKDTQPDVGTALTHKMPENAVCGETWSCVHCNEPIEVLAHDYAEATCQTLATCKRCQATTGELAPCTPGEPVRSTVVAPTCTEVGTGKDVVSCTVCGTQVSETPVEIPALGHEFGEATCNAPATCTRCPATEGEKRANHNVKAVYEGGTLKYVCASGCDIEFVTEQKYVADGTNKNFYFASNGSCTLDNSNGDYSIIWDGTDTSASYTGGVGGQPMLWIPSNNATSPNYLTNLNCESNALGVISFKMSTSMSDSFIVGIGKPRGQFSDWNTSILEIIRIGKVTEGAESIQIDGGFLDESSKQFHTTIPVVDGWSEWFDVTIMIGLKDDYTITLGFYINDVFCGSFVRDLKNPGDGHRTIDNYMVQALYINGWTYVPGSGFKMDDIFFGATANTEWLFDECDHELVKGDTVAPGCETEGYTNYTCACGATVKGDIVPATGHNMVHVDAQASTCITKGWAAFDYCSNHQKEEDVKVLLDLVGCAPGAPVQEHVIAAECGKAGSYEEVVYCSVCNTELSRETKEIAALEHDSDTVVPGTAATCTAPGLTDGAKCSKCGKEMTAQTEIPAKGHTIVADPAVEATCKTDGKTAGEHCSACDYKVEGTVVSKDTVPHTYDNDEDAECNVCGHTREVACQHTNKVTIPAVDATCTTDGSTAGEKCADCDEILTAPTTVNKTGHTEVADAAVEATCTTAGKTAGKHCSACDEVLVAQTEIPAKGHTETTLQAVDPTCTATGLTAGKHCTVCDTDTVPQVVIPAKGHNMAAATCDAPATCTVCGHTEGEALANHTLTSTVADGKVTYKCATCTRTFTNTHTQYYTDGSSLSGFTFNDAKTNASYAGTTNAPVQKTDADGNKYYEFLRDTEHNTTVDGAKASGQATMWIPAYHNSANPGLKDFTESNGTIAFVSFDIDFAMSSHLTMNIVYGAPSTGETWYESPLGKIMTAPLNIYTEKEDGKPAYARVYGFGHEVGRYYFQDSTTFTAFGSTGWFNIQMGIVLADDQITVHYYLDGQYVGSYSVENTLENNVITSIQLDGTSVDINSGYAFDNLAVGYANNATWIFDECAHQYGEATTVAPTCDVKGYDTHTCELCGYVEHFNFVDATGHNASAATCLTASVCATCGETVAPATNHTLTHSHTSTQLVYGCANCDMTFVANSELVYYDGSNASVLNATYVGGTSKYNNGANKHVSNGEYFEAITDQDATKNTESQLQMWIPHTKDQTPNGKNFQLLTRENGSTGVLSFMLNVSLGHKDDALSFKLVDNAWGSAGCIDSNVFQVSPKKNGDTVVGYYIGGWNSDPASLGTTTFLTIDHTGWTDWMDIKIAFTVNTEKDTVTALYYIDGKYVGSGEKNLTPTADKISCVYVNLNAWVKGTGYYLDDLAFGHTVDSHWTLDGREHTVTPATCHSYASCTCGWTGSVAVASHNMGAPAYDAAGKSVVYTCTNEGCGVTCEYTGVHFEANKTSDFYFASNGGAKLDKADGTYKMAWDGTDTSASNGGKTGSQLMAWLPHNGADKGLDGFTCENNTFGVISFRMRSSMSSSYNLSIGKERGYANWDKDGTWSLNYNVLNIGAYSENGVTLSAVLNGTTALATIPAAGDGWSEWFTVELHISLTDDGKITIGYYINGELKATATKDQYVVPSTGKYLDVRCFYINGWTYVANTGFALDDVTFGYTDHYTLDGKLHVLNTPEDCSENISCSCGWIGGPGAHDFGDAACISHCLDCGAVNTKATAHNNLVVAVDGDEVTYACSTCGYHYVLDGGMHDTDDFSVVKYADYTKTYENGTLELTNNGANVQYEIWVPGQTESPDLAGFTNANAATGFMSFRINVKNTDSRGTEFKINANRGTGDWGGPSNNGWSESSVRLIHFAPIANGMIALSGYNGNAVGSVAVNAEDGWSGWLDVVIKIQLNTDNSVSIDYYVNGQHLKTIKASMVIWTNEINSAYINSYTQAAGEGVKLENFYFGYTLTGLHETNNLYNEDGSLKVTEIGNRNASEDNTANVTNAALLTIVDGKIKQFDQTDKAAEGDTTYGYFVKEVGTSHYVTLEGKDGEQVEAVYLSRSVDWDTYASVSTQNGFKSEFRFAIDNTKRVTSISFDYILNGTLTGNRSTGNANGQLSIFQIKYTNKADNTYNPNDQYFDVITDRVDGENNFLVTDGEWHTFSYTFENSVQLDNFLIILSEFQGEFVLSNLVVTYE